MAKRTTSGAATNGGPHRGVRRGVADRRVQLLQLRSQVLPRGLPRHAGHARRGPHADGLPRERRRDGRGSPGHRGRRARLRPLHPVRRLRAALPEHALHRRLLPLPYPDGRPGQGDACARGRAGRPPAQLAALERAHRHGQERARAERDTCLAGARGRLGFRARPPRRGRDGALLRLRGGLLPHERPAGGRPDPPHRRRRVRAHAGAVVLRRPSRRDGLSRPGASVRRAQRGGLARGRRQADPRHRSARLHLLHGGLPELLRRRTTTSRSCSSSSWSPSSCGKGS